jgi:signal transduction histidine kinase/ActR/RegA family two-component response regulator
VARATDQIEERVLVLAPTGRDAQAAAQQLAESNFACLICSDIDDLIWKLREGAAVALVAEEAFLRGGTRTLEQWVARQPPWSDFPFVVLTSHAGSAAALVYRLRLLESLGNVSLLERPLNTVTLISAVGAALRARRRQYEVQGYLLEREATAAHLEDLVRDRTRELEETNDQLRQESRERKQAEAALQQAQKMETIGQLTGGVAHDFNNLLTAVLGNLELATRRNRDETIRRFLYGATQAAQRGAKLTSQLLAFSRTQTLRTESIDVNALVTRMGDLLFRTIGGTVRIETVLEKNLWQAIADPSQTELVVLNLAVNGRDAMKSGGRLTISTSNVSRDDPSKPADLAGRDYVALSVSDTGTGMTADVLNKAFEPFFTTKPVGRGTGLGLSQVYGIARQIGGSVSIATKLGEGTTVTVYLPRTTAQPLMSSTENSADSPLRLHEATILVVDDDADVRNLAVSCLETLGYQVVQADGGKTAIDFVASGTAVDLVLVDVAMPGINGVETIHKIHKSRPDLPVLYMTGYAGTTNLDAAERHLLKKPFTIAELAAKVEEILFPGEREVETSNVVPIKPVGRLPGR